MGFLFPVRTQRKPSPKRACLMKKTEYIVWFSNENYDPQYVEVSALNQGDALILAQAERIKEGLDFTLLKIEADS